MIDYGKFTASPEALTDDKTGETHNIIMLRNTAGETWHEVAVATPSPVYIAVDDTGRIVAMEADYQSIQIADVRLIGLDNDQGYSRGPGGSVYGKMWDGERIVEPPVPPAGPIVVYPADLWRRTTSTEAEQIEAALSQQPMRTQNIFWTAREYRSDDELWPLLMALGFALFGEQRTSELLASST